jgi:hypothetical protein
MHIGGAKIQVVVPMRVAVVVLMLAPVVVMPITMRVRRSATEESTA